MNKRSGGKISLPPGFTKVAKLGQGSGTLVWQVKEDRTGKKSALKLSTEHDPAHRLQREFAILKRLDIPGVLKVGEFGEHEGREYFTMEFIKGKPFTDFMHELRGDEGFAQTFLQVLRKTTNILSVLHSQGIIHADIKPANLLVRKDGEPVILDFGFAEDYLLTNASEPRGTLDYVAPELLAGERISPAADVYSLGAMCYEALSGKRLYARKSVRDLLAAKLKTPPALVGKKTNVPTPREELVFRMLQPDPALRPCAAEVAAAIAGLSKGERAKSEPEQTPAPRLCFGGRKKEIKRVEELVYAKRSVVFLQGEQGIGKTRLLRELRFSTLADNRNALLAEGRGAHLSLVERLAASLGLAQEKEHIEEKEHRYERIFQAIRQAEFDAVMIDVSGELSTDEETCLGYLARGFDGNTGFVLAGVPEQIHPAAAKVRLAPLSEENTLALVSRTFEGLDARNALAAILASLGKGNPGRMNELLQLLHHEHWLYRKEGWVYKPDKDKQILTGELDRWLSGSLERLDRRSRRILSALALAQSPLPAEVIAKVLADPQTTLLILKLTNQGFTRSLLHHGASHHELQNDLIRSYVLADLTGEEKTALYQKLATVLEEYALNLWGKNLSNWDDTCLLHLAEFYFKAGATEKAPGYLIPAGRRLANTCDLKKAQGFFTNVLECKSQPEEKKTALSNLGRLANIENNPRQAEEFYSRALLLVEENPEEKANFLLLIGLAYQTTRDFDRAQKFFEQSEACLANPSDTLRYQQLTARGWNAYYHGQFNESQAFFEQSLAIASSSYERFNAPYNLAHPLLSKGQLPQALEYTKKALQSCRESGDKDAVCRAFLLLAIIHRDSGKLNDAEEYLEEALSLTREMNYSSLTADILRQKAYLLSARGRYREARSLARQALDMLSKINDKYQIAALRLFEVQTSRNLGNWKQAHGIYRKLWREFSKTTYANSLKSYVLHGWAFLYQLQGDFLPAKRMLNKARTLAKVYNDETLLLWIAVRYTRMCLRTNNHVDAKSSLDKCKQILSSKDNAEARAHIAMLDTEMLYSKGENLRALETISDAMSVIGKHGFEDARGEALRIWGRALIGTGKFDEGVGKLRESVEVFKSHEALYEHGLSLYTLAETMFKEEGYSVQASSALQEAQIIFGRVGASNDLERITRFRDEHFERWRGQSGLSHQYLEGLRQVSELINNRLGGENFMLDLLGIVLELTKAQRGMIFMMDENELYSVASKRMNPATTGDARRISQTVIQRIQQGLRPIYTPDATADERFNRSRSILLNDIRSLMCIPLRTNEKLIGTIYLDSSEIGLFDAERTLYFEALGNLLAATIDKSAEFARMREELLLARQRQGFEKSGVVIGTSPAIAKLYAQLEQIAKSDTNILLEGETGTGKGLFAHAIHEHSLRRGREFCSINCGVLPENLFESELFGYRKGTFTGATENRIGLLEAADGSTVFFDEITNTSPNMQAKLLEVIEERVIRRFGEPVKKPVNLRFIFATNRDLKEEVRQGRFREDLYFRISTLTLTLPPLRDRREDIPEFIDFFLEKFSKEFNKDIKGLEDDVSEALLDYPWPGNIRELKNVIERAILLAYTRYISRDLLDQRFFPTVPHTTHNLQEARKIEERELIRRTLAEMRGNVTRAAKRLGVSRQHLSRLMKIYDIPRIPY
jgi:Nif-specific regulatory protein